MDLNLHNSHLYHGYNPALEEEKEEGVPLTVRDYMEQISDYDSGGGSKGGNLLDNIDSISSTSEHQLIKRSKVATKIVSKKVTLWTGVILGTTNYPVHVKK